MPKKLNYKYHRDETLPENGEIWVFGSNLRGRHGRGAAQVALEKYGAEEGQGIGYKGNSFAIPTKDRFIRSLNLSEIKKYVDIFRAFTYSHPEFKFFVTRVGCGYAGYRNSQIAGMFANCNDNCIVPVQWKAYLH